ncbi:MAG: hypothetical protein GF392_02515 [Candidatus Omnitrophica bacterium]|nr:hypothetical protein [Candidatus Omnitrophota bacterium]
MRVDMVKSITTAVLIAGQIFLLSGCGGENNDTGVTGQEREKSVFWQTLKPRMQLDPIEEKHMPSVYYPVEGREQEAQ